MQVGGVADNLIIFVTKELSHISTFVYIPKILNKNGVVPTPISSNKKART